MILEATGRLERSGTLPAYTASHRVAVARSPRACERAEVFADRLVVSLTLRIGDQALTYPAGSVKTFAFEVTRIGFRAELSLVVSSEQEPDTLFDAFTSRTPIVARLSVEPLEETPDGSEREPLVLEGVVMERTLHETASGSL